MKIMKLIAKHGPAAPTAISEHFALPSKTNLLGEGLLSMRTNTKLTMENDINQLGKALLAMMAYEEE